MEDSMISKAPFPLEGRRVLLLAEGCFSPLGSKTAVCFLRYRQRDVAAVIDSSQSGKCVSQVLGFGGDIPVIGTVEEALSLDPEVVIVGVAPRGGSLDVKLKELLLVFAREGIDIVSGLHQFLQEDPDFAVVQGDSGSKIWDVRDVPRIQSIASGRGCTTGAGTILVAGTDCNTGKMTCTYELYLCAKRKKLHASWAATGQTGIILRGRGIAVDRVVSDFIGGAAEELVNFEGEGKDMVFVEGQGSLIHPGFAGVALGLMFGIMPDCIIMTHEAGREKIRGYDTTIPPLLELIDLHEAIFKPLKKVEVVGIAMNTDSLEIKDAAKVIEIMRKDTGLPVTDPVRFGSEPLVEAVLQCIDKTTGE